MTWQCPRCMVTFREELPRVEREAPAKCEQAGCNVLYKDRTNAKPGLATMFLIKPHIGPAMEEYRRHYEKDFPDA